MQSASAMHPQDWRRQLRGARGSKVAARPLGGEAHLLLHRWRGVGGSYLGAGRRRGLNLGLNFGGLNFGGRGIVFGFAASTSTSRKPERPVRQVTLGARPPLELSGEFLGGCRLRAHA